MPKKTSQIPLQNASRKNLKTLAGVKRAGKSGSDRQELVTLPANLSGSLAWWIEQYFKFEVRGLFSNGTILVAFAVPVVTERKTWLHV